MALERKRFWGPAEHAEERLLSQEDGADGVVGEESCGPKKEGCIIST